MLIMCKICRQGPYTRQTKLLCSRNNGSVSYIHTSIPETLMVSSRDGCDGGLVIVSAGDGDMRGGLHIARAAPSTYVAQVIERGAFNASSQQRDSQGGERGKVIAKIESCLALNRRIMECLSRNTCLSMLGRVLPLAPRCAAQRHRHSPSHQ